MTLEIDPQTQFAQKWDSLSSIMCVCVCVHVCVWCVCVCVHVCVCGHIPELSLVAPLAVNLSV